MTQEQYWKERCEAAEALIKSITICNEEVDWNPRIYAGWTRISNTKPPAPVEGEGLTSNMSLQIGDLRVDCFDEDSEISIHINDESKNLDVEDVKELIHFLRSHLYHETGEIAGSRWRGEQGQIIKALTGEEIVNTETVTTAGELPPPTCGARWVRESDFSKMPVDKPVMVEHRYGLDYVIYKSQKWTYCYSKSPVIDPSIFQYWLRLDESPCTCQPFPTREEAEKWAESHAIASWAFPSVATLAMYDWLAGRINK